MDDGRVHVHTVQALHVDDRDGQMVLAHELLLLVHAADAVGREEEARDCMSNWWAASG